MPNSETITSAARRAASAAGLAALLCAGTAGGQQARHGFNYQTWDQYLGGHDSAQYSGLDQIDRRNVEELEVAWTYSTGERGSYLFNPIVVDGVMYVLAHGATIVALNAATGEEIWRHDNDGRVGTRGVNYWESADGSDKRLLYLNNGLLTSIDATTGATMADFGNDGFVDLRTALGEEFAGVRALQTNNPGRIFEDIIIMSLPAGGAGYDSSPADIHAYDVRSGELVWTFHTVPRPGEFGADTWPADIDATYGGVHNWSESTVDTERGIVFIPTGTARYDFYGANRHGANLYGNSVLALDARTGERLWHFQTIHHDLWDYDLPTAPKLLTVEHDGREVDAVAQVSKQGFVFVFDRETGEPLWPIEERPVPQSTTPGEQSWPTQPFPTKPPPFARQGFTRDDINPYLPAADRAKLLEMVDTYDLRGMYTPPSLQGTIMLPGHNGGANWGGTAVDPDNGLLYVASKDLPTTANLTAPSGDGRGPGAEIPGAGEGFVPYTIPIDFMIQSNGLSAIGPPWSIITAFDLNSGEILWQVPNGNVAALERFGITNTGSHAPRGGLVVTAGGLLFVATSSDRKFRARDVRDGSVIWEHSLPAASEGVPAVYEVDGRQYVAIAVGGNGLFSQGLQWDETGAGHYRVFALPE